jgi:hypothetical protein
MRSFFRFVRFDNDPNRPLSKDEHRRWKSVGWVYLLLWAATAILFYYILDLPTVVRWIVLEVLIVATPALSACGNPTMTIWRVRGMVIPRRRKQEPNPIRIHLTELCLKSHSCGRPTNYGSCMCLWLFP